MSSEPVTPSSTAIGFPESSSTWLSWLKARFSSRFASITGGRSLAPQGSFGSRRFGKMT